MKSRRQGCSCIGDLEDSPRVILVVCNASVTHSPLGHNGGVKASIVERDTTTARRWLASSNEAADSCIPSVLLLDFTSFSVAEKQKCTSHNCRNDYDADNDACGNASLA